MTNRYWVTLNNELPRFGSGRRLVEVLSVGPKWVRLRHAPTNLLTGEPLFVNLARVPRAQWDQWVARGWASVAEDAAPRRRKRRQATGPKPLDRKELARRLAVWQTDP